jgi:hypothetical protein
MALLSFRGITTPSLPAQGEQRRFFYFNIDRDNSGLPLSHRAFLISSRCEHITAEADWRTTTFSTREHNNHSIEHSIVVFL